MYCVAAVFFILFVRLFHLQMIQGEELRRLSENNCIRLQSIDPPRGLIYDRDGKILVGMYWIDMQWNGRIRVGIELDGGRIVCHEIFEANNAVESQLRTPNLPFRIEQENVGATGSTSELRIWAASVHNESLVDFDTSSVHLNQRVSKLGIGADEFMMSIRPGDLHFGLPNRLVALMNNISVSSYEAGNPVPVVIKIYQVIFPGTGIVGGTWTNADDGSIVPGYNVSAFEVNSDGTWAPQGLQMGEFYVDGTENHLCISHITSYEQNALVRWANGIQPEIIFVASPLNGGNPDVSLSVTWKEIG
jgi:hypothetical protein